MSVTHPDILKFINAKQDKNAFKNFNISVKVTNTFIAKLQENPDAVYIVINPRTGKKYSIPHIIVINSYTIDNLLPESRVTNDCYTTKEV